MAHCEKGMYLYMVSGLWMIVIAWAMDSLCDLNHFNIVLDQTYISLEDIIKFHLSHRYGRVQKKVQKSGPGPTSPVTPPHEKWADNLFCF